MAKVPSKTKAKPAVGMPTYEAKVIGYVYGEKEQVTLVALELTKTYTSRRSKLGAFYERPETLFKECPEARQYQGIPPVNNKIQIPQSELERMIIKLRASRSLKSAPHGYQLTASTFVDDLIINLEDLEPLKT